MVRLRHFSLRNERNDDETGSHSYRYPVVRTHITNIFFQSKIIIENKRENEIVTFVASKSENSLWFLGDSLCLPLPYGTSLVCPKCRPKRIVNHSIPFVTIDFQAMPAYNIESLFIVGPSACR